MLSLRILTNISKEFLNKNTVETTEGRMVYNQLRILFPALVVCLILSACGGKKQTDEIIIERDAVEEHHPGVLGMPANPQERSIEWIGDAKYHYSIVRSQDKSLPHVTNHDQEYYDNSIMLVVKRSDGSVFFEKKFTKKDFERVLPDMFRENGVLLGMNFEKVDGNNLRFVVSVGSPDENNEEFYLIMLTLNNQGRTSTETYQVPAEEETTVQN